jgi:hypothetical protein
MLQAGAPRQWQLSGLAWRPRARTRYVHSWRVIDGVKRRGFILLVRHHPVTSPGGVASWYARLRWCMSDCKERSLGSQTQWIKPGGARRRAGVVAGELQKLSPPGAKGDCRRHASGPSRGSGMASRAIDVRGPWASASRRRRGAPEGTPFHGRRAPIVASRCFPSRHPAKAPRAAVISSPERTVFPSTCEQLVGVPAAAGCLGSGAGLPHWRCQRHLDDKRTCTPRASSPWVTSAMGLDGLSSRNCSGNLSMPVPRLPDTLPRDTSASRVSCVTHGAARHRWPGLSVPSRIVAAMTS